MSAVWLRRRAATVAIAAVALAAPCGAPADSMDRVQLGVGMGAIGAMTGAAVGGSTGAAVGGIVGFAVGAAMANDPRLNPPVDPEHQRRVEAERAAWATQRQASEAHLRNEQRLAFEQRLQAEQQAAKTGAAAGAPSSPLVEQIQRALMRVGYEPGVADGVLTSRTVAAIESYEVDHRLPRTGTPSKVLLEHLRREGG